MLHTPGKWCLDFGWLAGGLAGWLQMLTRRSNVVAYTASTTPPLPYRFKSSSIRLQVPDLGLGTLVQKVSFFRTMGDSATWRALATTYYTLKTWMRRTVWGDRVSNPALATASTTIIR
jgi:hypothetical protein